VRAAGVATLMSLCLAVFASAASPQSSTAPPSVDRAERAVPHTGPAASCRSQPEPVTPGVGGSARAHGSHAVAVSAAWPSQGVTVRVEVFAHVLRTSSRGGVPRARIRRQVDVLNGAFAGRQSRFAASSEFRFRLAEVDVTVNRAWYRMNEGSLAERRAKHSLHEGTSSDLNLYIANNSAGVLGWGSQPSRYAEEPRMDGVVIARHTMPGGSGGRYSAGDAAVHETGHWLSLFHTFAGRCTPRGDRVADTPAESRPSYECQAHRDTCSAHGIDPVHNYMDYGADACMNRFTPGQVARMQRSWLRLRETGAAAS